MSLREKMIRETEAFLERELNRDTGNAGGSAEPRESSRITIPAPSMDEEDALFIAVEQPEPQRKVS